MTPMTTTATREGESTATRQTLFLSFEFDEARWKLFFATSPAQPPRERTIRARATDRVLEEIAMAKQHFGLSADTPVASCYEASREGFWVHRFLQAHGIQNRVVDSSSIEVPRRARRAKTDRIDGRALLRLLMRHAAGERKVWSVVHVPSVEAEDARQLDRELETAKRDRARVINRIHGLLATQGVRARLRTGFLAKLPLLQTGDGHSLPSSLQARLMRDWTALEPIQRRIEQLVAARRASDRRDPVTQQLQRLRGVAANGAAVFSREMFGWRDFQRSREVGAFAGLAPTPYRSGDRAREQGIGKAGNRRVRTMAVEIAWCWLRYQPTSALAQWYKTRFGTGSLRMRRVGIVALARKLLIALWRYVKNGVVPEGALLKTPA